MERPFSAYQGDKPYIFVSYSHSDAAVVYEEITALKARGFNIWYDEGIPPGSNWRDELAAALANCYVFLFYISPRSVTSENCGKEVSYALSKNRPVLCVKIQEAKLPLGLEFSLNDIQTLDKSLYSDSAYGEKVDVSLKELLPAEEANIDGHEILKNLEHTRSHSSYLVNQKGLGQQVKLTLIHDRPDTSHIFDLLKSEADHFGGFQENIAQLLSSGKHKQDTYYLFEPTGISIDLFLDNLENQYFGYMVARYRYKQTMRDNYLPLEVVFKIARQFALIFQHLILNDKFLPAFSPSNFSIDKNWQIKLVYPSLSLKPSENDSSTYYASPEPCLDLRSNYYSVGILLYEFLMKSLPGDTERSVEKCIEELTSNLMTSSQPGSIFEAPTGYSGFKPYGITQSQKDEIRPLFTSISNILKRLLMPDPKDRYFSPLDMLIDVEKVLLELGWEPDKTVASLFNVETMLSVKTRTADEAKSIREQSLALKSVVIAEQLGLYCDDFGRSRTFKIDGDFATFDDIPLACINEDDWVSSMKTVEYHFVRRLDATIERLEETDGKQTIIYWKVTSA